MSFGLDRKKLVKELRVLGADPSFLEKKNVNLSSGIHPWSLYIYQFSFYCSVRNSKENSPWRLLRNNVKAKSMIVNGLQIILLRCDVSSRAKRTLELL